MIGTCQRQAKGKDRAGGVFAPGAYGATVQLYNSFANGQPQATAHRFFASLVAGLVKLVKNYFF